MADLRGEQLKDSYQNVVTRGTGNKLENGNGVEFADLDDKASLSGGADANFTVMPQVDGSPIVERDSNDDGEWVRFADGTQIVARFISELVRNNWGTGAFTQISSLNIYKTGSASFAYPLPFTSIDSVYCVGGRAFADSMYTVFNMGHISISQWDNIHAISYNNTEDGISVRFSLNAIGRWK